MNPIVYTNYFIYSLYRGRDEHPAVYAALGSAGLLALNVFTTLSLTEFQRGYAPRPAFWSVLVFIVAAAVNYFALYRNGKHSDLFESIAETDKHSSKWWCAAYLGGSILAFLGTVLWIRYQKFGEL